MKKLNKNGSVLVSAVTTVLLVFIILGVCLVIATGYQKRAINEHARKQAYLNGLSVAEAIAGQIGNGQSLETYLPDSTNKTVELTVESMPNNVGGSASIKLLYDTKSSDILYIQVTSTYNQSTEEVQLTMQNKESRWYIKTYSKIGDEFSA